MSTPSPEEIQPSPLGSIALAAAKQSWWILLLGLLIGGLAGFGYSLTQPRLYAADASVLITSSDSSSVGSATVGDSLAKSRAKTYITLATSRPVAEQVIQTLGLTTSADALVSHVTATVPTDTAIIKLSVTDTDPNQAQQLADTWVEALRDQVTAIEGGGTSGTPSALTLQTVNSAVVPKSPVSPNYMLNTALGVLVGGAAAAGIALLRYRSDRRIRSAESVERAFGTAVIGTLPDIPAISKQTATIASVFVGRNRTRSTEARFAEAVRELRTNLQFVDVDNPPKIVVLTSPLESMGKSTTTASLAMSLAEAGQHVIVVDGDLRRPNAASVFGMTNDLGVTDVLAGTVRLTDALQPWPANPNLMLLAAGSTPPNPSELLGSRRMRELLHTLSQDAMVLVDAPPLLPVTDAAVLSASADGTIVLAVPKHTTVDALGKAFDNLRKVNAKVLGVVLNRVPASKSGSSYGYYGYGSAYYTNEARPQATAAHTPAAPSEAAASVPAPAAPWAPVSDALPRRTSVRGTGAHHSQK